VKDGSPRVGDRTVQVSSVAKPFFPDPGLTKGDLLAYYRDLAEVMLSHLRGRSRPWTRRHQETTGIPRVFSLSPVGKHAWSRPPPDRIATSSPVVPACRPPHPGRPRHHPREQLRMNPTSRQNDGALPLTQTLPTILG
jgi:hypothetical protein